VRSAWFNYMLLKNLKNRKTVLVTLIDRLAE